MKEIVDPTTGEIISTDDTDTLIEALGRVSKQQALLTEFKSSVALLFFERVRSLSGKTRRVSGERLRVKLTMPDDKWDQASLKHLWKTYPDLAKRCLGVERIRVMLRDWKKMQNEAGTEEFDEFKTAVAKANLGPQGLPRIEIEADDDASQQTNDLPLLDDLPNDGGDGDS